MTIAVESIDSRWGRLGPAAVGAWRRLGRSGEIDLPERLAVNLARHRAGSESAGLSAVIPNRPKG